MEKLDMSDKKTTWESFTRILSILEEGSAATTVHLSSLQGFCHAISLRQHSKVSQRPAAFELSISFFLLVPTMLLPFLSEATAKYHWSLCILWDPRLSNPDTSGQWFEYPHQM
jgi:hypothetical protein